MRNIDDLKRLQNKASTLPCSPGVYLMEDSNGKIIYVGKSRALHNRVSQYFSNRHDIKTSRMVSNVNDFRFIVCKTEMEALALENKLIKLHKPKYNILLKDAKSYPYIRVNSKDKYPTIEMTRTRLNDGAEYYGPFSSTKAVNDIISTVRSTLGIPSCKKKFPEDIGKGRPCINYQIKKCVGICTGNVSEEDYSEIIKTAGALLKGGTSRAIENLNAQMKYYSDTFQYEKAARARDTIRALDNLKNKSVSVTSPDIECDVFGFASLKNKNNTTGFESVSAFYIRSGYVFDSDFFLFDDKDDFTNSNDESTLVSLITRIYENRTYIPSVIVLSFRLSEDDINILNDFFKEKAEHTIKIKMPKSGIYKELADMALTDAIMHTKNVISKQESDNKTLFNLANLLGLEVFPEKIEAYDISNFGNDNITAGQIVVENGTFAKKKYRLYNIKSTDTADDYTSMKEVISRRISKAEKEDLPDLILLDGGKGHVNAVRSILPEDFNVPVFGMVKDDYHKTRTLTDGNSEIDISRNNDVFRFIYGIQEEVHRYSIKNMQNSKRKNYKKSSLEKIDGIGKAKARILLKSFGSIASLRNSDIDEISAVKGISKKDAEAIYEYFKESKVK